MMEMHVPRTLATHLQENVSMSTRSVTITMHAPRIIAMQELENVFSKTSPRASSTRTRIIASSSLAHLNTESSRRPVLALPRISVPELSVILLADVSLRQSNALPTDLMFIQSVTSRLEAVSFLPQIATTTTTALKTDTFMELDVSTPLSVFPRTNAQSLHASMELAQSLQRIAMTTILAGFRADCSGD
jgi:hypothetical protein